MDSEALSLKSVRLLLLMLFPMMLFLLKQVIAVSGLKDHGLLRAWGLIHQHDLTQIVESILSHQFYHH